MTERVVSIDLSTDAEGMLPRQCPNCEGQFTIEGDTYEEEHYLNIRCPYCEWIAEFDEYLTEEQAAYGEAVAENEARRMLEEELGGALEDAFSDMGSSDFLEVETNTDKTDFGHRAPPSPDLGIKIDETVCANCGFRYAVKEGTNNSSCPVCR
ncbi:hypothetical protein [Halococcus thailandensis]|uniref:Uncharacterized protein n=1 Tax=Halococcus thailandensis JCM 13552 TaxID=1227457 RepID=M0NAM3_9EURY|nr:hypothetical protein [Halococcus thailandensis]EMA55002.1 hypothetical protein C451_05825 [Halococcus thailandensis JCM 13552]